MMPLIITISICTKKCSMANEKIRMAVTLRQRLVLEIEKLCNQVLNLINFTHFSLSSPNNKKQFFVSHKYSNYSAIQEVNRQGHEIAVHSIT
jgi:hypothetical protein